MKCLQNCNVENQFELYARARSRPTSRSRQSMTFNLLCLSSTSLARWFESRMFLYIYSCVYMCVFKYNIRTNTCLVNRVYSGEKKETTTIIQFGDSSLYLCIYTYMRKSQSRLINANVACIRMERLNEPLDPIAIDHENNEEKR